MRSQVKSDNSIQWVGEPIEEDEIEELNKHCNLTSYRGKLRFYRKCIFNSLKINVGDFVLISNADSSDPDSEAGCDIAKVNYLFDVLGKRTDSKRAIVQWYSRPSAILSEINQLDDHSYVTLETSAKELKIEVCLDGRKFVNDVDIETIFNKCNVVYCDVKPLKLLEQLKRKIQSIETNMTKGYPIYVCRFKLIRKHGKYSIVPVQTMDIDHGEQFVSPIKIINGNTVMKVQARTPKTPKNSKSRPSTHPDTPITNVCRNLSSSLNICDGDSDSDKPIYSIVDTVDVMKKKLRITDTPTNKENCLTVTPQRRSTRKRSCIIDPMLLAESPEKNMRRRGSSDVDEKCLTPRNKMLETPKRRSILKTPGSISKKKRSILFSHVPEEIELANENPKSSQLTSSSKSTARTSNRIRLTNLQPNINTRHQTDERSISHFEQLKENLHVGAVPKSLPCRENEFNEILSFVEGRILDECGGCMYISGVPGTGKTATVTEVIQTLTEQSRKNKLPKFDFIDINGMRLTEPRQAYVQIYRQLTGKTFVWEQARTLLDKRFSTSTPRQLTTVLLIDELDMLCNRRQDVVYNFLDWPTKKNSKLVVITIANTMDLPERLLMGKVTSRLGLTRLTFQPYSFKQLQEVVMSRLVGSGEVFQNEAIQLVARKVASVSGDCRRALDICRRATEIADRSINERYVTIGHVQQALNEMIANPKVQAIKGCSKMEQLILQAVAAEVTRIGMEEVIFHNVYNQIETIAVFMGLQVPPPGAALNICAHLNASRLLICEQGRCDLYQKMYLNVSEDDIYYALKT